MTHTPGPWHQHSNAVWGDPGYIKTEDGTTVAHAKLRLADARLIAAAPDLLAALEWAVDFLEDETAGAFTGTARGEQCLSALVRARGEA